MSSDIHNMVIGENSQIVPTEGVCVADEIKILCIIRDLVNTANPGCKYTLNLPGSMRVSQVFKEIAKTCGYVDDSISVIYELNKDKQLTDVELNNMKDCPLSELVAEGVKRHSFTIREKDGRAPQKVESEESTTSGYESRASSSTSHTSTTAGETFSYTTSDYTGLIKSETGYVGLVNQAMTCYLNSLIQTLFMTPEFRNAIYGFDFAGNQEEMKKSIPCQLQKLFLQLQTSKKKAAETTDLTKSFGWDSSEVWQQHDVQELFRVMFDALETKWKRTDQENLISQLYQGKLKDYVKCLECKNESARTDTFLDIPLVIRPFGSTETYGSVEEAMRAFVQPETLEGSNQYYCDRCQKKCNAHKGLKFLTFPYLLTLQMKRFDFDFTSMHRIKLNDKMTFPDILHLNTFIDTEASLCSVNGKSLETDVISVVEDEKRSTSIPCDSDEGIDEGIEVENGLSAASSSSEGSNFSSEAATNDKNARESATQGPYVYELFSIMIHAGSAAGGHYYAYIKSFKDGKWYSFNDQQVTKITYDDIRKTYGGSGVSRGFYSSAYASSTNAYMLMYRQIDKERNADFMQPDQFPKPLKDYLHQQQAKEEAERKQREIEKSTCKIKLYCIHPKYQRKLDYRFEIHKDKTLKEATEMAFKALELDGVLPLNCCRLVKYDDYSDALEKSFEGEENVTMGELLGGVKTSYNFDLLLETKRSDQVFQEYKPGGITVKVFVVDIFREIIEPPFNVRAYHVQTVQELKNMIYKIKEIPDMSKMRCVLERCHSDFRQLLVPSKTLKSEGFFKSNKVYIEYTGDEEDNRVPFVQSKFHKLIDQHQNTIRINVYLPAIDEVDDYKRTLQQNMLRRQQLCLNCEPTCDSVSGSDAHDLDSVDIKLRTTALQDCHSNHSVSHGCHDNSDSSPQESDGRSNSPMVPSSSSQDTSTSAEFSLTTNYNSNNEGQSPSPDDIQPLGDKGPVEHVECNSDQASPVMGPLNKGETFHCEENWDLEVGASADNMCASSTKDDVGKDFPMESTYRYFHTSICEITQFGQRSLTVFVDKRITLGAFKKNMESTVGITSEHFKVYRVYANNQEFESIRLSDTLQFMEDGKLKIKLGRALRPGEHRVKVFQLLVNESDSCKYLIETVVAKGMTVLESKKLIVPEVKEQCDIDIPLDR
ncbi:ubiquitin carboxyl-terminal hydrolase 47-like [Gigantopelta aegis]|uniref:ubiquitin carboxyl-terminal hydrolase 47-like n=1 Tax=Gigantopelta aegis TaxID=1735272 RepID=UPI001B889E0A|nr:ubiquitin carboxyl-terminal hydrolase 47-like [Gigantopelta aegis]